MATSKCSTWLDRFRSEWRSQDWRSLLPPTFRDALATPVTLTGLYLETSEPIQRTAFSRIFITFGSLNTGNVSCPGRK